MTITILMMCICGLLADFAVVCATGASRNVVNQSTGRKEHEDRQRAHKATREAIALKIKNGDAAKVLAHVNLDAAALALKFCDP